jgi:hypothetical protein
VGGPLLGRRRLGGPLVGGGAVVRALLVGDLAVT